MTPAQLPDHMVFVVEEISDLHRMISTYNSVLKT
jgi:hypothetical protein